MEILLKKMHKKIFIDTLGCAKNEYDSQNLAAQLMERGCGLTDDPEDADILIVNTCGFIEAAKVESINHIFDMARLKGESKKLVVTGCLSERYHKELKKEMPEVDLFTGVNDYDDLPGLLMSGLDGDRVEGEAEKVLSYRKRAFPAGTYSTSLKIAEGCNNTCSFCAIPKIRGKYRSKRIEDCVREAKDMADAGIREISVIAQDTSYYGKDLYGKAMLPELLRELCKVDGIEWIRLMYVYDDGITDELIEVIRSEDKIVNYIDIPIQHISDAVLKRMNRKSTGESIRATIRHLREEIPDIHIRTTILVGFPGETEEDFEELLRFVEETRIQRLGAFAFSDEEGTAAYSMDGKLDEETKNDRVDRLMLLQTGISESLNQEKVGRVFDVMVDELVEEEDQIYIGRTEYDAPEIDNAVTFTAINEHKPGDIVPVLITDAYEFDLTGEEVPDESAK